MARIAKVTKSVLRFSFLPLELLLGIVATIEALDKVLAWLGIGILSKIAAVLDPMLLGTPLGFVNGVSPISSWRNAWLWLATLFLAACLIEPITIRSYRRQQAAETDAILAEIRAHTGAALTRLADTTKVVLLVFAALILLGGLTGPVPSWIRWPLLAALGASLVIDGLSWSRKKHQYGLTNYLNVAEAHFPRVVTRIAGNTRFEDAHKKAIEEREEEFDSERFWG